MSKMNKIMALLACAAAALPTLDEDSDFFQFEWNPFGIHLGVEF